jgi:hypothetical protein
MQFAGETACATTASHLLALVGHASACQRPLAGAFFQSGAASVVFE